MDQYDVAISYARADSNVAEALARHLTARGFRVFFDRHRAETLWGERLGEVLTEIYARRACVVVVLVSRNYGSSRWTMLERNAARTRLGDHDAAGSVLPLCLDDTEPVGLETLGRQYLRPGDDSKDIYELIVRIVTARTIARTGVPPMTSPGKSRDHISNQPSLAVHGGQGGGAVHARVTSKTSVGLGAFGMTGLLVAVIAALTGVGWLAFEGIRKLPRDDQGRVTVFGVPVPVLLPGATDDGGKTELDGAPRPTAENAQDNATSFATSPLPSSGPAAISTSEAAAISQRLDGLWNCWDTEHRRSGSVTFTETHRATLVDERDADGTRYQNTPFAKWSSSPYEIVSSKTMRVGGEDVHVELNEQGTRVRLIGGRITLDCIRQRV